MTNPLDAFKAHMVKPSEMNQPNLILLYGNPGGGKSWLAASVSDVPGVDKVLIIDTENSTTGTLHGFDDEKIDIIPVSTHEGFESVLEAVLEAADRDDFEYDAVIIDTVDVAQSRALEHFEENAPLNKAGEIDGFKVWGALKNWTEDLFRALQEAPFISIAVLHSDRQKTESGPFVDLVALAGSSKNTVPGIPDLVGFVSREGDTSTVHLGSSQTRSTKNRFHLPNEIEDPTMKGIFDAIKNRDAVKPAPAKKKTTTKSKKEDK